LKKKGSGSGINSGQSTPGGITTNGGKANSSAGSGKGMFSERDLAKADAALSNRAYLHTRYMDVPDQRRTV
jgi:hypothetical protein